MTTATKGLKLLRHEFYPTRMKTPPTSGSASQKRKLNLDDHRNGPHSKRSRR